MSANTVTVVCTTVGRACPERQTQDIGIRQGCGIGVRYNKTTQWMSLWPIPHPVGCLCGVRYYRVCPALRLCMPGYGVANFLRKSYSLSYSTFYPYRIFQDSSHKQTAFLKSFVRLRECSLIYYLFTIYLITARPPWAVSL